MFEYKHTWFGMLFPFVSFRRFRCIFREHLFFSGKWGKRQPVHTGDTNRNWVNKWINTNHDETIAIFFLFWEFCWFAPKTWFYIFTVHCQKIDYFLILVWKFEIESIVCLLHSTLEFFRNITRNRMEFGEILLALFLTGFSGSLLN